LPIVLGCGLIAVSSTCIVHCYSCKKSKPEINGWAQVKYYDIETHSIKKFTITDLDTLNLLASDSSSSTKINFYGKEIQKNQITSFQFGKLFNLTTIPNNFLYYCTGLNCSITIPDCVTKIGNYFMVSCKSFNSPLTIPDSVTEIGASFLSYCTSFNSELILSNSITKIGSGFL
jgi:hypothetical protein